MSRTRGNSHGTTSDKHRAATPLASLTTAQDLDAPLDLKGITFADGDARYIMLSFPVEDSEPPPSLTSAEREVLQAVLDGKTNAAIAEQRGTSSRTVANQVASLFRKFGASSRLDLARRASSLLVGRHRRA